jgi:hypothetical protein
MKTIVTQEYLDGIREGRKLYERMISEGLPIDAQEMVVSCRQFIESLKACAYSQNAMDVALGERDFWICRTKETS